MTRISLYGSVDGIPAHILLDTEAIHSLVSLRFALSNNLSRNVRTYWGGVVCSTCHGPVQVPTFRGQYTSAFEMKVQPIAEPFDVIIGEDWIAFCHPHLSQSGVEDPSYESISSLPEAHTWTPTYASDTRPSSSMIMRQYVA